MKPPEVALSRGDRVRRRVDGLEGVVVAVMPRHVTVEFRHQHGSRSFRLSFLHSITLTRSDLAALTQLLDWAEGDHV